jgi:hypothetical protein
MVSARSYSRDVAAVPAGTRYGRASLSYLDDDLAFRTSFFDVSQSFFGRFE